MRRLLIFVFVLCACFMFGCSDSSADIVLEFDGQTAYFNGSVKMLPINGDEPNDENADIIEKAVIKLKSNIDVKMRLMLAYQEGSQNIEGLKVKTSSGIKAVVDGMVLYESVDMEKNASVELTFFLSEDTPISEAGKSLNFIFRLLSEEVENEK